MSIEIYSVIGLMSGTSLDGVDVAYCRFYYKNEWRFSIEKAEEIIYSKEWKERLSIAPTLSGLELSQLHVDYGVYLGTIVKEFIESKNSKVDFVASHGHTVFHTPHTGLTLQIGGGAAIAAQCGLPVICDFRTTDVAYGGQGAPLVPIGDSLLFNEYRFCLNLGGIANISFQQENNRLAFDICPVNMALNQLSQELGLEYDKDGIHAQEGTINPPLLKNLNALDFYSQDGPKSLGREWFETNFLPLINNPAISINDRLATVCEHAAIQIATTINKQSPSVEDKLLITGGGAFNDYLIERIQHHTKATVVLPDVEIIKYKEALIFAFLGVLRIDGIDNCLSSVTGASKNSCSGALYMP